MRSGIGVGDSYLNSILAPRVVKGNEVKTERLFRNTLNQHQVRTL